MIRSNQNRAALLAPVLRTFAGGVMLTALAVAPLNYGSSRPMPFQLLITLVATGAAAWLLACAVAHAWTPPPRAALWGAALVGVSAAAWLLVLERPELPAFTRRHYAHLVSRWPYSIVPRSFPLVMAWSVTAIAALFALCDLARETAWRRAIAGTIVFTGAAVALLGLVQNATGAQGIYWDRSHRIPGAFFGPFFHHTAAGAYLNTVWPLGLGLTLVGLRDHAEGRGAKVMLYASLACVVLVLAAHFGHVSRFPQVIAACVLLGFALWAGLWRAFGRIRGLRVAVAAAAVALGFVVVALGATRVHQIRSRWHQLELARIHGGAAEAFTPPPESEWPRRMRDDLFVPSDHRAYPLGDRGATYATALAAIRERPWFGWGPGGWTAAAAAHSVDPFIRTFFLIVQFTHNDLLQAAVEWGLIGAVGWLLLVPGAVVHALVRLGSEPARDYLGAAAVAALTAVLVQSMIDFPLQIPAIQFNAVALSALAWSAPGLPAIGHS